MLVRRPDSPAGPALLALVALVAAPLLTYGVERWALTARSADPWWGSGVVAAVGVGIWVFNLTGFVLLCLVFPHGPLPGRWWRAMPWLWLLAALGVVLVVAGAPDDPAARGRDGRRVRGVPGGAGRLRCRRVQERRQGSQALFVPFDVRGLL